MFKRRAIFPIELRNQRTELVQALLFVAGFCIYAINGTAWACATDVGGRVFSGTSAGLLDFSAYMGAAVQAVVYGFLVDKIGWGAMFASLAILCVAMAFFGLCGRAKNSVEYIRMQKGGVSK